MGVHCIVGGTGSLGNALAEEILKRNPTEIRVFSRDEEKQLDMQRKFADSKLKYIIGDVRDEEALNEALKGVDFVYHVAALKIIPVCEEHAYESVKTNLLGSINVKKAAIKNGVNKAIFVSTDKAVQPINVYGACKMIAERMWVQDTSDDTSFNAVRYGNVIGSRGSIVPFFKDLIAKGKPVPITHPEMTRFLLTLKKAVETILYASEEMTGGEIIIPKISACRIVDIPEALAGRKYPLVDVGVRAGEKINEVLICGDELRRTEEREDYYVIHNYGKYREYTGAHDEYNSANAQRLTVAEIQVLLKESGWL